MPATLKVFCNIRPAGLQTGHEEGFTLDVGDLSFYHPLLGLTIFTSRPPFDWGALAPAPAQLARESVADGGSQRGSSEG